MKMLVEEDAIKDFLEKLKKSWTWNKLTQEERERFENFLENQPMVKENTKGNSLQRWALLHLIYYAFLMGCGYHNQPTWRE